MLRLAASGGASTPTDMARLVPATTTYLGHRISIEPFEWGFIAHVIEPGSDNRFLVANATVMGALERAFEAIDERLHSVRDQH